MPDYDNKDCLMVIGPLLTAGFTLSILFAIEQGIEPVWSVWPCDFCKVIKRNRRAKPDEFNTRYSVNEVFCPFNFVKIEGTLYHRSRRFFDGIDDLHDKEAIDEMS